MPANVLITDVTEAADRMLRRVSGRHGACLAGKGELPRTYSLRRGQVMMAKPRAATARKEMLPAALRQSVHPQPAIKTLEYRAAG